MGFFMAIFFFAAGVWFGTFLRKEPPPVVEDVVQGIVKRELDIEGYKFIHPLLSYETPESDNIPEFQFLESKLQEYIDQQMLNDEVDQVSVYFRDFKGTHWIMINGEQKYTPASLLKVPIMIAIYKVAEERPEILQKMIRFEKILDINQIQYHVPSKAIELGKEYTVEDLISYMIIFSDNNATILLVQNIDQYFVNEVFTDLGLSIPSDANAVDFMTVKQYAYFFRVLRNSTYLTRAYSEKALWLLAQVDFEEGIVAGVHDEISVAQKYGERAQPFIPGQEDSKELHDCGIVYYPNRPYLLCAMTQGKSFEKLEGIIGELSEIVYETVDYQYKNKWALNIGR
jgi:beta-lactamase class A